jgi:tetratricopeptide (TPR) repeat protein
MRTKRQTTQEFRDTLEKMLQLHYRDWENQDLGVGWKTIKSWISGDHTPNPKNFAAFLEQAAKFPPEVATQLWRLYLEIEGKSPDASAEAEPPAPAPPVNADPETASKVNRDHKLILMIRAMVSKIVRISVEYLNPQSAGELIDQLRNDVLPLMEPEDQQYVDFYIKIALISIYRGTGRIDELMHLLQELEAEIYTTPDLNDLLKGSFYHHRGVICCYTQGNYLGAIEDYQQAKDLFHAAESYCDVAGVLVDTGMAHWCIGNLLEADKLITQGRNLAESHDCKATYMIATGNLGLVYLTRGLLEEALAHLIEHLNLAQKRNFEREIVRAHANRGIVYYFMGRYEEALEDLKIDVRYSKSQTEGMSLAQAYLGLCYLKLGQYAKARKATGKALWIAQQNNLIHAKISALRAVAECATDADSARETLLEALNLTRGRSTLQEAACLLSLARLMSDSSEGKAYYREGKQKLKLIGAEAWITSPDIEEAPFIVTL